MPVCTNGQSVDTVVVNRQGWHRSCYYGGPLCTDQTGAMSVGEKEAPMPGGQLDGLVTFTGVTSQGKSKGVLQGVYAHVSTDAGN